MKRRLRKIASPAVRMLKPSRPIPARPLCSNRGAERGTPLGRHYVDRYMEANRGDITGAVLEIKNRRYTDSLGHGVVRGDVLDIDPSNRDANIIADLAAADDVPSDSYDCFILDETLQFVYDLRSAAAHAHRILRPGGVLFATVPCTVQHDGELKDVEMWRFTRGSCLRLFSEAFAGGEVEVETYGNFATCVASLAGVVLEEIDPALLEERSPLFVQGVCVRARKAGGAGT